MTLQPRVSVFVTPGRKYSVRIETAVAIRMPCLVPAGIQTANCGGMSQVCRPAHTSITPLVAKINKDVVAALNAPEVRSRLLGVGIDNIIGSSPEELARFIRAEIQKYGKLVKAAGIKQP